MDILLEILKITIPSLIVFLTAFFSIKYFIENDQKKRLLELKHASRSVITPIRLQAYERMAMFLERIEPSQLVLRLNNPQLTVFQFQTLLISSIRGEFEHNLSQQVYISSEVWDKIKMAKEEMIKIIYIAAGKLDSEAPATALGAAIFEQTAAVSPIQGAMEALKEELRMIM